jgi:hypothetical protein
MSGRTSSQDECSRKEESDTASDQVEANASIAQHREQVKRDATYAESVEDRHGRCGRWPNAVLSLLDVAKFR